MEIAQAAIHNKIPIVNNSGLIVKQFDGMVTRRDPLPARTEYFDTEAYGTGDGMLYYEVLVYYSSTPKTFSELYTLIGFRFNLKYLQKH